MNKKEKDELFASQLPGLLSYHHTMLSDPVRNKLLYKAIRQHVSSTTNFLDIGAGTGVWAILAAKLGAKRVVAVEIEEALIPMIFKHAQENGVANNIEIIHGKSDDVKVRGKFDVIVSELFGNAAFGENTVRSFIDLRNRFLAQGGVLIPQSLKMFAAPIYLKRLNGNFPAGLPLRSDFVRSLKLNYASNLPFGEHDDAKFLARPQLLADLDFITVTDAPHLNDLTAGWKLKNVGKANAIVAFNQSVFADDVLMNGFDSKSWGSTLYQFVPFEKGPGEIFFKLAVSETGGTWSIGLKDRPEVPVQNYSPVFAFARTRMAQQMTPHKKFKSKGPAKKQL